MIHHKMNYLQMEQALKLLPWLLTIICLIIIFTREPETIKIVEPFDPSPYEKARDSALDSAKYYKAFADSIINSNLRLIKENDSIKTIHNETDHFIHNDADVYDLDAYIGEVSGLDD